MRLNLHRAVEEVGNGVLSDLKVEEKQ